MTAKAAYSSIRFRRWSRASYAVFASLHRAVSIGRISADIADASLSKSGNTVISERTADSCRRDEMHDTPPRETPLERTAVFVPEEPSCPEKNSTYTNYGRELPHAAFPTFFILYPCLNN